MAAQPSTLPAILCTLLLVSACAFDTGSSGPSTGWGNGDESPGDRTEPQGRDDSGQWPSGGPDPSSEEESQSYPWPDPSAEEGDEPGQGADSEPGLEGEGSQGGGSESGSEPEAEGGCSYPAAPLRVEEGSPFPSMAWPGALSASGAVEGFDLEGAFCEPEPGGRALILYWGFEGCPACTGTLDAISGQGAEFEAAGARWIFLIDRGDALVQPSATVDDAYANEYVNWHGVGFGLRADDRGNARGAYNFVDMVSMYGGPWIGILRASDMTLYDCSSCGEHAEQHYSLFDPLAIARELAGS